jgi:hypothetical protein
MGLALTACKAEESSNDFMADALARFEASDETRRNGMSRVAWRNFIIDTQIGAIDSNYQTFEQRYWPPDGSRQTLTDGSRQTLTTGTKAALERNTICQRMLQAIFAQMDARRTSVLVRIRTSQLKDAAACPLALAVVDIVDYEQAGTIPAAIQAIVDNATRERDLNDQILARIARAPK